MWLTGYGTDYYYMDYYAYTNVGTCAVGVAILMRRKQRQQKSSKCRSSQGAYYHLVQELRLGDVATYRNFVRMDAE